MTTTACTTRDVHTLTCCTHIFLLHSLSAHIRTSSCVSHTRMAQVPEKVRCACVISLHLAISCLMIHPSSLLFLDGHFETTPDCDLTDSDVRKFLPYSPVLKAQDMRHPAPASRSLATGPSQMQTQKDKPHGVVTARVLFDATNGIAVSKKKTNT